MRYKIIGISGGALLIAEDLERYYWNTPAMIYRDGILYRYPFLTIGIAYKFVLWRDANIPITIKKNLDFRRDEF